MCPFQEARGSIDENSLPARAERATTWNGYFCGDIEESLCFGYSDLQLFPSCSTQRGPTVVQQYIKSHGLHEASLFVNRLFLETPKKSVALEFFRLMVQFAEGETKTSSVNVEMQKWLGWKIASHSWGKLGDSQRTLTWQANEDHVHSAFIDLREEEWEAFYSLYNSFSVVLFPYYPSASCMHLVSTTTTLNSDVNASKVTDLNINL